ncbi:MAG: hypothetical protein ACFB20_13100 [Opitutales bacterium]
MSEVEQRVSLRELHSRTGHYVRQARQHRIVVTDNGEPIAEIRSLTGGGEDAPYFANRKLLPKYKKLQKSGALRPRVGRRDITELISEDRDAR